MAAGEEEEGKKKEKSKSGEGGISIPVVGDVANDNDSLRLGAGLDNSKPPLVSGDRVRLQGNNRVNTKYSDRHSLRRDSVGTRP